MNTKISLEPKSISAQIFEKLSQEPTAKGICEHHKNGGACNGWTCNPSIMNEFDQKLAENNIPHAYIRSDEGALILVSRDVDKEGIKNIRQDLIKESKTISELSLNHLKAKNIGYKLHTICGVSETYSVIFKNEASKAGMNVSLTDNKDGTYDVHYSSTDKVKAESVIMKTISATRGELGRFNEMRILADNRNEKDIYTNITNPEKEFYIVSPVQPKEYMRFTPSGYEHYRNGQLIGDELRSNTKFQIDAHNRIDASFIKPIVLSKEEFDETRKMTREEYIYHVSQKQRTTRPNMEEKHRMELEIMARQIAEYKMSYENNELNTNFYDRTVTVSTFENMEYITDKQIDREDEMIISNPKSMPPEIQATIDKTQYLPMEDREYIDERVKEYMQEARDIKDNVIITEITQEDISEDLDLMLAYITEEQRTYEVSTTTEERDRD